MLNAPNLKAICQWLSAAKKDPRTVSKDAPHLRDLLKAAIWNELTSDREKHHALSNVLGAFLLGAEVAKAHGASREPTTVSDYLRALVRACGIDAGQGRGRNAHWIAEKLRKQIPAALLIDDMADLWGDFLDGALDPCIRLPDGGVKVGDLAARLDFS